MTNKPTFELERLAHAEGHCVIAGSDEVGRGAMAGPIVAAAVVLDPANIPDGIDDSKRLSPLKRTELFDELMESSMVGVGVADVGRVDRDNVLRASLWAMAEAVSRLAVTPNLCLVDGPFQLVPDLRSRAIIRGDQLSLSIAAASVIAKVTRDRMMIELAGSFPQYGFQRHKGYGTREHLDALRLHGPCAQHRYSCELVQRSGCECSGTLR
jgi:ribonuclease HII